MTASEFPQKDIDKCKECQTKESTKKIHLGRKKWKAWNWGKQTEKPVTLTEGLAATDKSYNRWLFSQGSSVADVWRNSKCGSLELCTTGAIQANLELPLLPNSLDSQQTQNNKIKFWTDPSFLLPWKWTH